MATQDFGHGWTRMKQDVKSGDHAFVFDAFTSEINKHSHFHTGGFQLVQKLRLVWSVITEPSTNRSA
jgi:hypothetical protein